MAITLDIGGEGRHPRVWNLNPSSVKTFGRERGQPIPRLISGRAEMIPFPDRSIRTIIAERTPLSARALTEIARVVAPSGWIILRHVQFPCRDRHALAQETFGDPVRQRVIRLGSQIVQETCFRQVHVRSRDVGQRRREQHWSPWQAQIIKSEPAPDSC